MSFGLSDFAAIRPEIALLVAAIAILILEKPLRRAKTEIGSLIALFGIGAAGVLLVTGSTSGRFFDGVFAVDAFTNFFRYATLIAGGIGTLTGATFQRSLGFHRPEHFALLLLAMVGVTLTAGSRDLALTVLTLETGAIASYALLGTHTTNEKSRESMMKSFLLGSLATILLVIGVAFLFGATGATRYDAVREGLAAAGGSHPFVVLGLMLILAGIGFRLTVFPFCMFAPDALQGAPATASAVVSATSVLAGAAGLARLGQSLGVAALGIDWSPLLWAIAALTILLGNLVAIYQDNVRRMVAYSTVAHAGYVFLGLAIFLSPGVSEPTRSAALSAVLVYLVVFVFMQAGAFLLVSSIFFGKRHGEYLPEFAGIGRRCPVLGLAFLLVLLSLAGLPPTAGFLGRFGLLMVAFEADFYALGVVALIGTALGFFYYLRVAVLMYFREDPHLPGMIDSMPLRAALGIVAIAVLFLGLFPAKMIETAAKSVGALF